MGTLNDNLPHNTCQIYVKPRSKNTQMTLADLPTFVIEK